MLHYEQLRDVADEGDRMLDANDYSAKSVWFFLLALPIAIFTIDLWFPLGVAVGVLYAVVMVVTLLLPSVKVVGYLAVMMSLLVIAGYVVSDPGGIDWMVIVNRLLSLFMIWVTAWLVCLARRRGVKLDDLKEVIKELNHQNDLILMSVSEGILGLDVNGMILSVNPAAARMLGWQPDELVGQSFHQLLHDANPHLPCCDEQGCAVLNCIQHRIASCGNEQRILRKDGSVFPVAYSVTPVTDEVDAMAMVVTFQDISERYRAENELRRYQSIVAICDDHMSVIGPDYHYLAVNEAYLSAHQQSREKIVGHSVAQLLGEEVFDQRVKERLDRCFRGEVVRYSDWFVFPRGGERYMAVNYYPCVGEDGYTVSSIVVTSRDITAQKRVEMELEQSERQFRSIFDNAPLGMALLDKGLQPFVSNNVFTDFFGYAPAQLVSHSVLELVFHADAPAAAEEFSALCSGQVDSYSTEKRFVRNGGSIVWGALTASSIRGEEGARICGVIMVEDITARKEAEERIRHQAQYDALTELPNRRHFDEVLEVEWGRGMRAGSALSVLMIDIDEFKSYNDFYGHAAGDDCLVSVAGAMFGVLQRPADHIARYGGEEFVVLLPESGLEAARHIAEQIRARVESLALAHAASSSGEHVTVSIGCASTVPATASTARALLRDADENLYLAKKSGRNRVC
jgi:diguanylate cyclase (GGDEF)-like protein/PAS domain S-box-containing protein